ncbi:MAG: FMN-binding negative transcriptional regulator [Pirellulales bacterium]|nr:FMN-binding negative transcriptional regulator [Pirellulales bacterium]
MYIPRQFVESRVEVMHQLIRAYPLATLVNYSLCGLNANHIPLYLSESPTPYGTLQGHIARANPLLHEIAGGIDSLVIFHGPSSYISPSWYSTKQETGKVVPTWNYIVVHAYGVLSVVDNPTWLRAQLDALTNRQEALFDETWAVSDSPADYIENIMQSIVGVEMVITKMLGKWKVSQNQTTQNQISVISGLKASGHPGSESMAALMENKTTMQTNNDINANPKFELLSFPDSLATTLGQLMVQFQALESTLVFAIGRFLHPGIKDVPPPLTMAVLFELPFATLVKLFAKIPIILQGNQLPYSRLKEDNEETRQITADFINAAKMCTASEERRNQLMHSNWLTNLKNQDDDSVMRVKSRVTKKGVASPLILESVSTVTIAIETIKAANHATFCASARLNFFLFPSDDDQ